MNRFALTEGVEPPLATAGEQNTDAGAASASPQDTLMQMLSRQDDQASPNQNPASPPAQGGPEVPMQPAESEQTGQNNLSPEDTPRSDEPSGGDSEVQSPSKFNQLLEKLDATQRGQLEAMLNDVATGKTSWNEIKSGRKLSGTVAELQEQIEQLKARDQRPANTATDGLPQFDSVDAAKAHQAKLQRVIRNVEQALERYPNGDVPKNLNNPDEPDRWRFGNETFTRQEMLDAKWQHRDLLDAMPERIAAVAQQTAFKAQQARIREDVHAKWPQLADPENPEAIAVRQLIAKTPLLRQVDSPDFIAAALLRGMKDLNHEAELRLAGRSAVNGNGHNKPSGARPPAGSIPVGRPHAAAGGVPARSNGQMSARQALNAAQKERTPEALARLLDRMDHANKPA